ncbi:hypothetical protein [Epilithonimonas hungarica]|uniref:Uncharacterized protein n=1 Tax=Epilithonimonas hungarica TaxID=454006 RepID=A0A1G7F954_9FLAO|nr:hypothetical protein [Epilithonimonas hungarica]SDE72480.1 hypothetical protein SAMN05421825_0022 [Epilithonimonas hungarica]
MARGRKPTFPTEIHDLKCLNIRKFNEKGYLKQYHYTNGEINFSSLNIDFAMKIGKKTGVLVLNFGDYKQIIQIVSKKSNLGAGLIWFFECSETGLNGRKLYLHKGKFVHRKGVPYNYAAQNYGKNWRFVRQLFRREQGLDIPEYKREYYNGKLTKNYSRFLKALEKTSITANEFKEFRKIVKL